TPIIPMILTGMTVPFAGINAGEWRWRSQVRGGIRSPGFVPSGHFQTRFAALHDSNVRREVAALSKKKHPFAGVLRPGKTAALPNHHGGAAMPTSTVIGKLESETIRRISWRLLPFLIGAYLVNYIDRVNVGFAALQMNKAVGIDPKTYGLGAGIFFLGYFLL